MGSDETSAGRLSKTVVAAGGLELGHCCRPIESGYTSESD